MVFFSSCGENADQARHHLYTLVLSGTLVTLTILGQVQILILFIIPLMSHERQLSTSVRKRGSASSSQELTKKKENKSEIIGLVKKCLVLATICMIVDVSAAMLTIFLTRAAGKVVYDFNIFISVLCCIMSFKEASRMIFPFYRIRSKYVARAEFTRKKPQIRHHRDYEAANETELVELTMDTA